MAVKTSVISSMIGGVSVQDRRPLYDVLQQEITEGLKRVTKGEGE
jgi:hypothetical protein